MAAIAASATAMRAPAALAQAALAPGDPARTVAAFLDTLFPGGEGMPSAGALGMWDEFLELMAQVDWLPRLAAAGADWLDRQAGGDFAALPLDARTAIIDAMSRTAGDGLPFQSYFFLRHFAMELYWSRPETILGLPLEPAPQPVGYPPPWT